MTSVLICWEQAHANGVITGHSFGQLSEFTKDALTNAIMAISEANKKRLALSPIRPTGNIVVRSVTKLDEPEPPIIGAGGIHGRN